MSRSYNKVILVGHVGADAEQRSETVATFSLATNASWKNKDGGYDERTDWHRVTAFGKLAEPVLKHVKKGSALLVEGELRTDSYEKDGETRYATFIALNTFRKMDGSASSTDATATEAELEDAPF